MATNKIALVTGGSRGLGRNTALALARSGIDVAIAPGAIETDFAGGVVRANDGLNKMIAGRTALGRVGLPEDIGPAVAALLSDANRWVDGQSASRSRAAWFL